LNLEVEDIVAKNQEERDQNRQESTGLIRKCIGLEERKEKGRLMSFGNIQLMKGNT